MADLKYDLIIAGTGFASTFFLKKYLEKSGPGKRVLVLERGQYYSHSERILSWQGKQHLNPHQLESHDSTFLNSNPSKPWIFDVNFGGSSNCWWACTPRFMPNDFKIKTLYGRGRDWPISYDDIEQYYCEAESIMHISGPECTPFPRSKAYPQGPHPLNAIDKAMQSHFGDKLWISQPSGRPSEPVGNRSTCCSNYTCNLCPIDSKFSIENSLKYLYDDPRVELQYGLQVYMLEFENGVAKRVVAAPTFSNPKSIKNRVFEGDIIALGTNPIFNAHILLNSGDSNPFTGVGIGEQKGIFANVHLKDLDNVGGISSITANGYMLYDGSFRKENAACLVENHNSPTLIRNERAKWRKIVRFKFVFEALSDKHNRVTLSDNILKPNLIYHDLIDQYIVSGKSAMAKQLENLLAPLKPEEIFLDERYVDTECHIMSSATMGSSDADSVVDKTLIHHKYRNLFVLGASSFPTTTASNPTLTICALSLMAADKSFSSTSFN